MCGDNAEIIVLRQDAFAASYQEAEFTKLVRAIKYAGLIGKDVRVIGRNADTLRPTPA